MRIAIRLVRSSLLAAVFWTALAGSGLALDGYTIRDIAVDVTAGDAVAARARAMDEAQRRGLVRLMDELTGGGSGSPDIASLDLNRLVRSIDVEEEQLAATRYIAKLTVTYDRDAIDEALQNARAPMVLGPAEPLLIVPAIDRGQGPEFWGPADAWRAAWRGGDVGIGLLDVRLPSGDANDQAVLNPEIYQEDAEGSLRRLAERHGAAGALVVLVTPSGPAEAPEALDLSLPRAVDWPAPPLGGRFVADRGDVYAQAANAAANALEKDWQDDNLVRLDNLATVSLRVPLAGLSDWVQVRQGMESLPEVRETVVRRLSQREATLELRYIGGREALFDALGANGMRVSQEANEWRLRRAGVRDDPWERSPEPPRSVFD